MAEEKRDRTASEIRRAIAAQLNPNIDPNAVRVAGPYVVGQEPPSVYGDNPIQPRPDPGPDTGDTVPNPKTPEQDRTRDPRQEIPLTQEEIAAKQKAEDEKNKEAQVDDGSFTINQIEFTIPPEQISIQKEIKNVSVPLLRASSSQKIRTGHGFVQVSLPLTFVGKTDVDNKFIPLIYTARRSPFVWVENKYLRKVLMPIAKLGDPEDNKAMMFAIQSVTVQSVENLPTTIQCFLQLLWFNYLPYVTDLQFKKDWSTFPSPTYRPLGYVEDSARNDEKTKSLNNMNRAPLTKDKVKYFNELQEPVRTPAESDAWAAFIRGHSQYRLPKQDWGPQVPPTQYFNIEYRRYYKGSNPPQGYRLEDSTYSVYYKDVGFHSSADFLPVHVSISFQNRVASLPLLEQQLPTAQFMGSSDRMFTIVFFVTPAGQAQMKAFNKMIQEYESQVIEFRQYAKDMFMKMWNPIAYMCGLGTVVPDGITTETIPGNPGSSMVRVTFSEYNLTPRPEPLDINAQRQDILQAFVEGVFGELGDKNDVVSVGDLRTFTRADVSEDLVPDLPDGIPFTSGVGVATNLEALEVYDALNQPFERSSKDESGISVSKINTPAKWLTMKIARKEVEPDQTDLWDFANTIAGLTRAKPAGFAYASDEQTYGLKTYANLPLYQDPGDSDPASLQEDAASLRESIRVEAEKNLLGELGRSKFNELRSEWLDSGRDKDPCYPDLKLPAHPADPDNTSLHTEPDFYIYNPEQIPRYSTHDEAKNLGDVARKQIARLQAENSQTDFNQNDVIKEKDRIEYKNRVGSVNLGNLQNTKHLKSATLETEAHFDSKITGVGGEIYTITNENIYTTAVEDVRQNRELGMRKAFPTFRLEFIREGRDKVTYRGFHVAYGGWAVNEIRMVASRKIPTDMCVITMANLDGFIETTQYSDIRRDDVAKQQDRLDVDTRNYLYELDDLIDSTLSRWNDKLATDVQSWFIRELMEFVRNNPVPGGYGPLGLTEADAFRITGNQHTQSQLEEPVTNLDVGIAGICEAARFFLEYKGQDRYNEVVVAAGRFPDLFGEIREGVFRTELKGQIQAGWEDHVADTDLKKLVEAMRPQTSAETEREAIRIAKEETALIDERRKLELRRQGVTSGIAADVVDFGTISNKEAKEIADRLTAIKDRLAELATEADRWKTRPPGGDILFREGTDVVLHLGYSNNPANLDTVFVGHVTEVYPSGGNLTVICQTFATELIQDIKGTDEDMTKEEGFFNVIPARDVDGPLIAEWIMTQPECKHFGRWEFRDESPEFPENERGSNWYGKARVLGTLWFVQDTVADDNIYLEEENILDFKGSRFTLNDRTLWQGLQDLAFRYPGYVAAVRPYKDGDWWRNTVFIGRPDFTYLTHSPVDIQERLRYYNEAQNEYFQSTGPGELYIDGFTGVEEDPSSAANIEKKAEYEKAAAETAELEKTRRERFRRYHMLTSYHDIIDNGIVTTKRGTYNAVRLFGSGNDHKFEKTLTGVDEQYQRWLEVENENAYTGTFNAMLGQNMATSMLLWHLKDTYQGEITILGNPAIKPYDVCYLLDNYNDFSGPVEVEQVVHTLNPEVGFITQIVPDLYVTISDMATRTNLGALGVYSYRWMLKQEGLLLTKYDKVSESHLRQQNPTGTSIGLEQQGIRDADGLSGIVAQTMVWAVLARMVLNPLYGLPLVVGAYFLGGYIRNHATVRIVPVMHKGHPYVTGLQGFKAPRTMEILLEEWQTWRKGVQDKAKASKGIIADTADPQKRGSIVRAAGS